MIRVSFWLDHCVWTFCWPLGLMTVTGSQANVLMVAWLTWHLWWWATEIHASQGRSQGRSHGVSHIKSMDGVARTFPEQLLELQASCLARIGRRVESGWEEGRGSYPKGLKGSWSQIPLPLDGVTTEVTLSCVALGWQYVPNYNRRVFI